MCPVGDSSSLEVDVTAGSGPRRSLRRQVRVTAPSRLHFGLLSFGHPTGRQYGGIGLMIDRPAVCLSLVVAERFSVGFDSPDTPSTDSDHRGFQQPLADRVREFAGRWSVFRGWPEPPACRVTIEATPPQHVGLGTGTQLALSVAAGLNALFGVGPASAPELAISVGRGLRSAVGTYGFVQGGLILERGKSADEPIAPLDCRLELPPRWRVVLVQPAVASGLSGSVEQQAFENLPPVPVHVTHKLVEEIRLHTLPAAARGDFEPFSESVYRYGRLAGQCFAAIQGGPYNGQYLQRLVETIRSLGVRGVGQSSWGPTLFALMPDQAAADTFRRQLRRRLPAPLPAMITTPLNHHGARISVCDTK
jgi:beta-ribofuranosylaminobenzene 5'-phosphate synthase